MPPFCGCQKRRQPLCYDYTIASSTPPYGNKKRKPLKKDNLELPQIVQTVQKEPLVQEYSVLAGVAQRERRHSSFALDALMVVKVDIAVNHLVGFREGRRFVAVDTLRFEDGEEIFPP